MIWAGIIMSAVLVIFTLGKSPLFRVDRAGAAIIGSVSMIGAGVLTFEEAGQAVEFRTIVILFSMMVVVANLKLAGFFDLLGNLIATRVNSRRQLLAATIVVSGIASAVAINDIVCLLFTPVVLLICERTRCNPAPHLLGVAMASNIGSAATLLGNPQNILVGGLSGLSFLTYFAAAAPVAALGLACTYLALAWFYRRELAVAWTDQEPVIAAVHPYLVRKSLLTLATILLAYIAGVELAMASAVGAAFLLITRRVKPNKVYTSIDFNLLIVFIGLFVIVAGLEKSRLMDHILQLFSFRGFSNLTVFAFVTTLVSNIVSNVPAVLLLKFFIPTTEPELWWKALALFSTLAGNLTITGSIANLIVVEIARRQNVEISARDYFVVGFPLTIVTTAVGALWLQFFG
jgi:Na+/H+ antiporter NhaD/arsenite permease-like protein